MMPKPQFDMSHPDFQPTKSAPRMIGTRGAQARSAAATCSTAGAVVNMTNKSADEIFLSLKRFVDRELAKVKKRPLWKPLPATAIANTKTATPA